MKIGVTSPRLLDGNSILVVANQKLLTLPINATKMRLGEHGDVSLAQSWSFRHGSCR